MTNDILFRVADPGGVDPDTDQAFKKPRIWPSRKKTPDPTLEKQPGRGSVSGRSLPGSGFEPQEIKNGSGSGSDSQEESGPW